MRLGEMLVREGQLTRQQLQQALKVHGLLGDRLGTTLLEEGLIAENVLLDALGRQRSTRTVSAAELAEIPAEVVRLIPARLAERYGVVPFHLKGRTLSVASMNAGDLLKEDEIGFLTSCMVRTCIALELRIHEALERYYRIAGPPRHGALARRLGTGAVGAPRRPVSAGSASPTPAAARVPAAPPAAARPVAATATPRARSQPVPATGRERPPAPAPRPQPRFIELDDEDAALLGQSASESSEWSPPSDEPVILEPVPLPWLARETAVEEPGTAVAVAEPGTAVAVAEPAAPAPSAPPPPETADPPEDGETDGDDASLEERLRRAASGLKDAEIRDDIADVLLEFCEAFFRRRLVLVVRKDHIVGWRGEGEGVERERVRAIEIPAHDPSVFLGVTGAGSFWLGSLPPLDANRLLIDGLGGTQPRDCLVLPVILKSRVVCYLYGDNLDGSVSGAPIAELRRLVAKAGLAFQVYIMKNKLRML